MSMQSLKKVGQKLLKLESGNEALTDDFRPYEWTFVKYFIVNKSFSYQDTPPLRSFLVCILNFDKTSKIFSKCNHLFGRYLEETHFVHKSWAITQLKNKEKQMINVDHIYIDAYAKFYWNLSIHSEDVEHKSILDMNQGP